MASNSANTFIPRVKAQIRSLALGVVSPATTMRPFRMNMRSLSLSPLFSHSSRFRQARPARVLRLLSKQILDIIIAPYHRSRSTAASHNLRSDLASERQQIVADVNSLPSELLIQIFQIAAQDNHQVCLVLCLVSTAARAAVLPILLRTVTITDRASVIAVHEYLSNDIALPPRMPDGNMHHSMLVKDLCIDDPHAVTAPNAEIETKLMSTLMKCGSLRNLVVTTRSLWSLTNPTVGAISPNESMSSLEMHQGDRKLRMQVLPTITSDNSAMGEDTDDEQMIATALHAITAAPTWPFPLFSATTHLYLHFKLSAPTLLFAAFPRLTHLALPLISTLTLLTESLDELVRAPSLARLAVTISPKEYQDMGNRLVEWTCEARQVDPRVCPVVTVWDANRNWRDSCDVWENTDGREISD